MTPHDHTQRVPGCYRCELGRDEAEGALVEEIAEELYAGGPWGEFFAFADEGARAITDAHSMRVYREMARTALALQQKEAQ